MKQEIIYSFDRGDETDLARHFEELDGYVRRFSPPEHSGLNEKNVVEVTLMHPGLRAFRRIRGNSFTAEHLTEALVYVKDMADRSDARTDKLDVEQETIPADGSISERLSRDAYKGLAATLRADAQHIRRLSTQCMADFEEEVRSLAKVREPA